MTQQQLLALIEWISANSEKEREPTKNDRLLLLNIYHYTHAFREDACCNAVHADWRKDAEDLYARLKKLGEL